MTRRVVALGLLLAAAGARGADFQLQGSSTLVSRRVGTVRRRHTVWLSRGRLRVDDGERLITIVRYDTDEVLIANREERTFLRQKISNLAPVLVEIDDVMARGIGRTVARTTTTKTIGDKTCTLCRIRLNATPCEVWVEADSEGAFQAIRDLARHALGALGDEVSAASPAALPFGSLRGIPREVALGDPEKLRLTWRIDRWRERKLADTVFRLPPGYREDPSKPAAAYTLPEHVYFLGEATASYWRPEGAEGRHSLLPPRFVLGDPELLQGFYKGQRGAEQLGIFRWADPLVFYLAPDLWRYPLSARATHLLLVIGTAYRGGGLEYYPALKELEKPPG
ncbi:MAG: hypothetical protein ACLF0G_06475 [Candidatus Brocadiia bacterium]